MLTPLYIFISVSVLARHTSLGLLDHLLKLSLSNYQIMRGIIHLYSMLKLQKSQCMWKVHIISTFYLRVYLCLSSGSEQSFARHVMTVFLVFNVIIYMLNAYLTKTPNKTWQFTRLLQLVSVIRMAVSITQSKSTIQSIVSWTNRAKSFISPFYSKWKDCLERWQSINWLKDWMTLWHVLCHLFSSLAQVQTTILSTWCT